MVRGGKDEMGGGQGKADMKITAKLRHRRTRRWWIATIEECFCPWSFSSIVVVAVYSRRPQLKFSGLQIDLLAFFDVDMLCLMLKKEVISFSGWDERKTTNHNRYYFREVRNKKQ
jgi:hypothetical protein